jgi:hypothetical protein
MTKLNSNNYQALTVGLNGLVYAFKETGSQFPLVIVTDSGVNDKVVISDSTTDPIAPLGMTLDPLTGDLFITHLSAKKASTVSRIINLYDPKKTPMIVDFGSMPSDERQLDGLAWTCDGTTLLAASKYNDRIIRFTRSGGLGTVLVTLPDSTWPDGIALGAGGTSLEGYAFVNGAHGTVYKFPLNNKDQKTYTEIAYNGEFGDWAFLDAQGNLLLIQGPSHLTRLSTVFGHWVLPGSGLCGDLGCGAKAATTPQIDRENQACVSGLNADLLITLSQSACGSCESCNTLNQARSTLIKLIDSLDLDCLKPLGITAKALYTSCPCNPNIFACVFRKYPPPTTRLFENLDFDSYDPDMQAFIGLRRLR